MVCTIGPASREPDVFRRLVDAGMDAVRLNFSHADHEEAGRIVALARDAARETGRPLAVVADLQGPKIRVGDLDRPLPVTPGHQYRFLAENGGPAGAPGDGGEGEPSVPTTYAGLAEDVGPGDLLLVHDGRLEFQVTSVHGVAVTAESRSSGVLSSHMGINLPRVRVRAPSLTPKDLDDLSFALEQRFDYVALSFVRRPEDMEALRSRCDRGTLVIAKIEKDRALSHLGEILRRSDAVMVARGDLGVELPYEEVPLAQKRILLQGQELAVPSITATQMLESMTSQPRPTRAEVSDVANTLLDGSDAVMLSAETATGDYPVESVRAMASIIRRIEQDWRPPPRLVDERPREQRAAVQQSTSGAIAAATMEAVNRVGAPFVVTFTRSGFSARVVSAQRPPVPILAVTDQWRTYSQLALVWGVRPVLFRGDVGYRNMLKSARRVAVREGFGEKGDRFVVTAGVPFHVTGTTNMLRIEEL